LFIHDFATTMSNHCNRQYIWNSYFANRDGSSGEKVAPYFTDNSCAFPFIITPNCMLHLWTQINEGIFNTDLYRNLLLLLLVKLWFCSQRWKHDPSTPVSLGAYDE